MSVAIGCDEAAINLKETIKEHLKLKNIEVVDYGVYTCEPSLYPDTAITVARAINDKKHERGILLCGTGIGMSITANKVPGIRAAVCHDPYSAERARKSNDAQIICMGARVIAPELAKLLIDIWMQSEFQGGGSKEKVDRISYYEHEYHKCL